MSSRQEVGLKLGDHERQIGLVSRKIEIALQEVKDQIREGKARETEMRKEFDGIADQIKAVDAYVNRKLQNYTPLTEMSQLKRNLADYALKKEMTTMVSEATNLLKDCHQKLHKYSFDNLDVREAIIKFD